MKKMFVSFCMASALIGLSSCGSTKSVATLSSIGGEWNIIEINGTAVVPLRTKIFLLSALIRRMVGFMETVDVIA